MLLLFAAEECGVFATTQEAVRWMAKRGCPAGYYTVKRWLLLWRNTRNERSLGLRLEVVSEQHHFGFCDIRENQTKAAERVLLEYVRLIEAEKTNESAV